MGLCGPNEIKLGCARKRKRSVRCSVSVCNGLLVAKLWALGLSKRHQLVRRMSFYCLITKGASQFGFTGVACETRTCHLPDSFRHNSFQRRLNR